MGKSYETWIRIDNRTDHDMTLHVSDVDNHDWEGHSRPDENLKNKIVSVNGLIREREEINAHAKTNMFTLTVSMGNNDKMPIRVDQRKAREEQHSQTLVWKGAHGAYVGVVESIREEGKPTLRISIGKRTGTLKFIVLGDPHIHMGNHENNVVSGRVRDHIKQRGDYPDIDYAFIVGDLTNNAGVTQEKGYTDLWNNNGFHPLICDGYGNHDMEYAAGSHADIAALIRRRNEERRKSPLVKDFNTSENRLHYSFAGLIDRVKLHFIMLNLCPTAGESSNREQNSSRALEYLEERLGCIPATDPIFLFHHYGWELPDYNETPDRWWSKAQRDAYLEKLSGHRIAGIFYGHLHTTQKSDNIDKPYRGFCCGRTQTPPGSYVLAHVEADSGNGELDVMVENIEAGQKKSVTLDKYTC